MAHTHEHEHTHEHGHTHEVHSPEETVALLTYMVGHNQHHAEELHELAHSVEGEAQDYTVVGRDEGALAIGFGYARFPAPWTRDYASFQRVMRRYAMEVY